MKKYIAPAIAGLLLTLSHPTFLHVDLGFLAWVALVPLVVTLRDKTQGERFIIGAIAGAVHFLTALYWLVYTLNTYGNLNIPGSVFVALLLVAMETAYVVLFSLLLGIAMDRVPRLAMAAAVPFLWVAVESLRNCTPFGGFPWVLLGYSQGAYTVIAQAADLGGVYVISFLVALVNGALVDIIEWRTRKDRPLPKGSIAAAVLLFAVSIVYGTWRIKDVEVRNEAATPIVAAALQGNIRQDMKWDENSERIILSNYLKLQKQAMDAGAELIVWPEAATPFALERSLTGVIMAKRLARTGKYTLLGSVDYTFENGRPKFTNSAYLVGPSGIEGKYAKMQLVPFSERLPFAEYLGWVDKIVKGATGNFNPGKKIEVFRLPRGSMSVIICYEAIFGGLVRRFRKEGAQLLVNITNDAWFGNTSAPRQHLAMAAFRCIENHCWMVRAANTGISAFVDPLGRVKSSSGLFYEDMLIEEVRFMPEITPYAMWGNIFLYAVLLVCIAGIVWIMVLKRKERAD